MLSIFEYDKLPGMDSRIKLPEKVKTPAGTGCVVRVFINRGKYACLEIFMDNEDVSRIYEVDEITFINSKDKNKTVPLIKTEDMLY